ncbi:MAG: hypothetical protein ACI93N_002255, partial [Flavobacteriaceae bacterium]
MKHKIILTLSLFLLFGIGITYSNTSKITTTKSGTTKADKINLNLKGVSVKQVFVLIEQQINSKFIYMSDEAFLQNKITIAVNNQDLNQ